MNSLLSEFEGRQAVSNKKVLIYSFMSANQAIRFALSLKQNLHDSINENERKLLLKIGISAGSPIDNDDDFFSRTIQEAVNLSYVSNNNIIISYNFV